MGMTDRTADVLIIGGGVAGLSTAYQLSKRGVSVILLERQELGAGSTGQAAGLLGQVRKTETATRMLVDGLKIVRELEAETGAEIFCQTGSVRLATTEQRREETEQHVELGRRSQLDVHLLDAADLGKLLPFMNVDDVLLASFCPSDGHLMPHELASAYAKLARKNGAKILLNQPVREIRIENGRVRGVHTDEGSYQAERVLNATGPWSYLTAELGESLLPTAALGHCYLTSRPSESTPVNRTCPAVRDYDGRIYSRPEAGGLIVGIYEAEPVQYDMRTRGDAFVMSQMRAARDNLTVAYLMESAHHRFPFLRNAPFTITTGIMTFTPDGGALCGRLPNVEGLFHCAGFCGHGIVQSPSVGVVMADLLMDRQPLYDLTALAADRLFDLPGYRQREAIEAKCVATYAGYYGGKTR